MAITLKASQCPTPQVPIAIVYATDNVPPSSVDARTGDNLGGVASQKLNQDFTRFDYAHRFPSGVYCVGEGLTLSAGAGLVMNVAAGIVCCDGLLWAAGSGSIVLPASQAKVFVWAKRVAPTGGGVGSSAPGTITLDYKTDTSIPANGICILGVCATGASAITGGSIETSGVMISKGTDVFRYTSEAGAPDDTPNASLRFHGVTPAGTFYWDGAIWRPVGHAACFVTGAKADANYTGLQTEFFCSHLSWGITGWTAQRNYVVPLNLPPISIYNTSGFGMQVIGASGTGIVIANNKTAIVAGNGTNIVRLSADF